MCYFLNFSPFLLSHHLLTPGVTFLNIFTILLLEYMNTDKGSMLSPSLGTVLCAHSLIFQHFNFQTYKARQTCLFH